METLPDYIGHDLAVLSIGLNPSSISVREGFYFANPRNRFWTALNASGLLPEHLSPSQHAQEKIFRQYRIGFTDVVKRHSATGKSLKAADYRKWAPVLEKKIKRYAPGICWFHGKMAAKNFFKYTGHSDIQVTWGMQTFRISESVVFVSPNPSPANAAYSLQAITTRYRELAEMVYTKNP